VARRNRGLSTVWIVCGAGRRVGKTHLARRLCRVLPRSVYAKHGHGPARAGKSRNYFRAADETAAFVEAARRRYGHVVVESNALARDRAGDAVVYVDVPPDRADVRGDADVLRAAANLLVTPCPPGGDEARAARSRWRRVLRKLSDDAEVRTAVCDVLADQAEFLARCRLGVRTKLWFVTGGGRAFGLGLADLLAGVDRTGSLRKAAAAAGMSYRYAWNLIRSAERSSGRPLIRAHPGGPGGGGSDMSLDGRKLLDVFRRLDGEVAEFAARRLDELYERQPADG